MERECVKIEEKGFCVIKKNIGDSYDEETISSGNYRSAEKGIS